VLRPSEINPRQRDGTDENLEDDMAKELCEATCPDVKGGPDFECERKPGHKGKHESLAGGYWTDGGAERLREERRERFEAEPF
jgi:hypothetical protein